jgi:DNA-binding LacI/PurR family transcriptional regulator
MPTRMEEVAKRAGVSVTTVSHVMNRTRRVALRTRKRVLDAVRELKYYKDAHARRLARGHSDFLGLIVSDICNPFFPEIIKSFEDAAWAKGLDLLLSNTDYHAGRTQIAVRKMIENKVRGVAIMTTKGYAELAQEFKANRVPVVLFDHGAVGQYMSNIQVDWSRGIDQVVEYLYGLGHKDFAFISGLPTFSSAVSRRNAFIAAVSQRRLVAERIVEGNQKVDGGIRGVQALLAHPPLPTAILCVNDITAIGALHALQHTGLRVPKDVSLVGYDDIGLAALAFPPLTTIRLSRQHLGQLAFQALQNIMKSKRKMGTEYVVETELVVRRSTSAPGEESKIPFPEDLGEGLANAFQNLEIPSAP